jgi:hypothetical protein
MTLRKSEANSLKAEDICTESGLRLKISGSHKLKSSQIVQGEKIILIAVAQDRVVVWRVEPESSPAKGGIHWFAFQGGTKLLIEAPSDPPPAQQLPRFLPICAQCKKIRLEDGSWQPIESFFREVFGVEFTHSYCGECSELLCDLDEI